MTTGAELAWREETIECGGDALLVASTGTGDPLLLLHEELGFPGPQQWQQAVARKRTIIAPQHPGFGRAPAIEWIEGMRDFACFYARWLRESGLAPIDVVGFSLGGWLAAEMAVNDPSLFSRMVLVSPVGIQPDEGEICDMFMLTAAQYLRATVRDPENTEEFTYLYGAEQTPETYAAFEEARAQTARLAWKPYLFNRSLPSLLGGVRVPTLVIAGLQDEVAPPAIARAYAEALPGAALECFDDCGHRPEIEQREKFLHAVESFLD